MALSTSPLGSTGLELTRVGLGTWAMGGDGWVSAWGEQDDAQSVATIRHAVEHGLNWIDTAGVYGLGHAETVVARALAPFSPADRPVVMTKGGMVWNEDDRQAPSGKVADEQTLRGHVEDSLRRLQVDVLDVYFIHWPATEQPLEEYWATMLTLREEGKVKAAGLSNHDLPSLQTAEALGHVDIIQPPFSAVAPEAAETVIPWARDHQVAVVGYSPMGSGLLTGAFTRDRVAQLPEGDWRRRSPMFTDHLDRNLDISDRMGQVAAARGQTQSSVAVAWTLGFPGVSGAIVGARRPDQLDQWLPAAELELTAAEYALIPAPRPRA